MQYQGGKSRIASQLSAKIRQLHPTEMEIWEPFCGGGAMTLALAKAGFSVHASDNHPDLILLWQALMRGETEPFADVTEEEYARLKTAEPSARRGFVGFGASFGGAWWGGYARRRFCGGKPATIQPYQEAARFCTKLRGLKVYFALAGYTTVPDHVLVYADPPYLGTKPYKGSPPFDHAAFWQWVYTRSGSTFVSELQGPDGLSTVWRKLHKSQNSSNSRTTRSTAKIIEREEKLFYKPARR